MDNVVEMKPHAARLPVWEGLLRVMEANKRRRVEISIDDLREIVALVRRDEGHGG